MDESERRISELAREVLRLSRNTLLVNLRFLDAALSRLEPVEIPELTYATDGRALGYDPRHVLKCYRQERAVPVRDYLHIVLHCVYRHMFVHTLVDQTAWDLACDIAVEYTITGLGLKAAEAAREALQRAEYEKLQKAVGQLTAEKLYRYYLDRHLSPVQLAELRGLFHADDHRVWYITEEEKAAFDAPALRDYYERSFGADLCRIALRGTGAAKGMAWRCSAPRPTGRASPSGCRWTWRPSPRDREKTPAPCCRT